MRLSHPELTPSRPIRFRFDGRDVAALEGETIAAALSACGEVALRARRDGSRAGLWCGMGACFDCVVTVDGRPGERACLTLCTDGMAVESGPGTCIDLPSAPIGLKPEEIAVDVAIVGAGPAGLVAGRHLAQAGLDVLVLDERPAPGGQYFKPLAGSHRAAHALDRQFAAGLAATRAAETAGVRIWRDATVWSAFAPDELGVVREQRCSIVRPRRLILAPGAYERPVPIPGWTLPGVMTTGALQTLVRAYRVSPGRRILVGGNGPLNLQLAVELVQAGVAVEAVVEAAPRPGLARIRDVARAARADPGLLARGARYLAILARHGVPVLWGARIAALDGNGRVEAARIETAAGPRRVAVDCVALGHGFIPSTELARQLGCRHVYVDRHVGYLATEAAPDGRTSLDHVFAIGDGAVPGGAEVAQARAVATAHAVLGELRGAGLPDATLRRGAARLARAEAFQEALWRLYAAPTFSLGEVADETILCRCEGVTAGTMRRVLAESGADAGTLKRLTRTGMGACQGRNCAGSVLRLVTEAGGGPPGPLGFFAPRPAAKPVPLGLLADEKPEWGGHRLSTPPAMVPRPARTRPGWGERRTDVFVIGGGVVGACVARDLVRAGAEVLVVDRDAIGQQASTANAGSLHVQLLSFDFGAKAQAGGTPAAQTLRLGPPAIALWREIAAQAGEDLELKVTGGLMVAETEHELRFLDAKAALERSFGIDTQVIGRNALRDLEPALAGDLIGAAHCASEGKINPLTATFAVVAQARAAGACFEGDAPVLAIERRDGGFTVETAAGRVLARRIVNCAGAWSPRISAMVARPIPVSGAPLQMMVTAPAPPLVTHLVAHAGRHLSLKQSALGSLLIGGGWSAGLDDATGASKALRWAIEGNAWVACRVLPAARSLNLLRVWAGMNINIDGAPILGEMPGVPGFFNCVTSNGYTLAPMVARMTAEMLLRGRCEQDAAPFLLDRF